MHETIFILGAGASIPYGFPSGSQLVDIIADRMLGARELDKCEHDSLLVKLLEENDREALIHFGDSLKASATNSIDSFLSDRREFRDLGKMCIVFTLREYEQKCKVRGALYDSTNTGNWYKYFFNLIKNLEEIKFKIYTFNYDRSLEYYLLRAFENHKGVSLQETFARVERLNITHLHGSVGSITRSLSTDSTKKSFGNMSLFDDVENLRRVSEMIDIIYEVDGNGKNFNNLREDIKVSKNIIFLGFGFGKENMGRLDLANTPFDDVVRIFATTYGITANELDNYLLVEMRELNRKLKERSNIIQRGIRADLYHYDLNVLDFMRNNLRQEVYK